ncbi:MAG: thrombospondin type 3 repeat-containing protein [Candidatus Moranbacteria bacterium]|nr:thrombospondin type 3 repeat-containing protein [Candidatus Moranbacteria bacterium]
MKIKKSTPPLFFSVLGLCLIGYGVGADERQTSFTKKQEQAFQSMMEINNLGISVPTVVDVPMGFQRSANNEVAVIREKDQEPQPYLLLNEMEDISVSITDPVRQKDISFLVDNQNQKYVEYPASKNGNKKRAQIEITFDKFRSMSSLTLMLAKHVALPETAQVESGQKDSVKAVLVEKELNSSVINFPETTSRRFVLKLSYIQPLRLAGLKLGLSQGNFNEQPHLRFLAHPNNNYKIYFNADRQVEAKTGEAPNLRKNQGVRHLSMPSSYANQSYVKADTDKDGVPDEIDNCVWISNEDQVDVDKNGRGDACDDFDRDGIINSKDNCPDNVNRNQRDSDLDGVGDACDKKENRALQNQPWLPAAAIITVFIVVGFLIFNTIRKTKG